jgi:predicted permease
MNFAWRIYRRLAQAFPHEFKVAYGADVMQLGEDVVNEIAKREGVGGLIRFVADIAIRVPIEYVSEMRRDLRYALRGLFKSPGFALVGIISMGLGIGLTTTVFTAKWAMLFRDLPAAANAHRLTMLEKPVSYYYIEQYREQKNMFSGVAAFQTGVPFNVSFQGDGNGAPQRIFGQLVSTDYFSVLGVPAQQGRVLSTEMDKRGDTPVVVISDRFWRNRLNSSPNAIGETLHLNGQPATIVGITPKDFNGALSVNPSELFVPVTVPATLAPELANDVLNQHQAREFLALLCLAPGVSIESAEAALRGITQRLDQQDTSLAENAAKGERITLLSAGTMVPIPPKLKLVVAGFFLVLMGLIMTIACVNLANMLLARGANRRKELAIRLAVGASRFRLVRQMMSEGILLSVLGGIAGFALSYFIAVLNSRFIPPSPIPLETSFTPDWHAALMVLALAVVCGIGFSLVPALRATKTDLTPSLKDGEGLQMFGYRRFGLRNLLMVAQVAGSLMLLLITGFLVIGITEASRVQTKIDPSSMVLLSVDPIRDGYSTEKARDFFEKLPERLKTIASVRGVAMAAQAPFSVEDEDDPEQWTAEDAHGGSKVQIPAIKEVVGAGYFSALSEPVLAGREFTEPDQHIHPDGANALPAILNESAARGFFGKNDAIGQRIRSDEQSYEVVGVVRDTKAGLSSSYSVIYLPLTERNFARPAAGGMTILVRTDGNADASAAIRRELAFSDPRLNLFNVRTLKEYLDASRAYQRFSLDTYGGMGIFGLILSAIGLAGLTAYAVAQRRREIGIRMALGARTGQVLRLVLREGTALVVVGTGLGFLGAFAITKMLAGLTNIFQEAFKIGTNDPRLLLGAPLLLAGLAMLACYVPARKAAKIDPLKALRQE